MMTNHLAVLFFDIAGVIIPIGVMIMQSNDFEQAFGDFLDRREYDQAENALFAMVRIAFLAGWKAAGGNPPPPQKIIKLMHQEHIDSSAIDTDLE